MRSPLIVLSGFASVRFSVTYKVIFFPTVHTQLVLSPTLSFVRRKISMSHVHWFFLCLSLSPGMSGELGAARWTHPFVPGGRRVG